jgi:hypothetical protein
LLLLLLCRLVRPGDRVLLVSCSYEHQPASGPDFFKHYTAVAERLQVHKTGKRTNVLVALMP